MKKMISVTVIFTCLLAITCKPAFAAEENLSYVAGEYYSPGNFSEGFASVSWGTYDGYIDMMGERLNIHDMADSYINITYGDTFSNGYAVVRDSNYKYGLIDRSGYLTVPFSYQSLYPAREGLCLAQNDDGKWGFIDTNGAVVIPFVYDGTFYQHGFSDDRCAVQKGLVGYYIDKAGIKKSGDFSAESDFGIYRKGVAPFRNGSSGNYYYIDKSGANASSAGLAFSMCYPFFDDANVALVKSGSLYGFVKINGSGKIEYAKEPQYSSDVSWIDFIYNDNCYILGQAGSWMWYNGDDGSPLLSQRKTYYEISLFHNGYAGFRATDGGNRGLVDKNGNEEIAPKFDQYSTVTVGDNGLICASVNYKYGYYHPDGTLAINETFSDANPFANGFARVTKGDSLYQYLADPLKKPEELPYYTYNVGEWNGAISFIEIKEIYFRNPGDEKVYLAQYTDKGALLKLNIYPLDRGQRNLFYNIPTAVTLEDNCSYYKVFVWSNNLEPLAN